MSARAPSLALLLLASACQTTLELDRGRPYACVPGGDDAAACGEGWRCGLNGRCHARGDAQPWACAADADCEADWVCGLEQTCHDPTVLADWLCTADRHCTAPWRCGFAGRCLDAAAEVSVPGPLGLSAVEVLGPRFFTGQPDALVAADLSGNLALALGPQVRVIRRREAVVLDVIDFDAGTAPSGLLAFGLGAAVIDDAGTRGFSAVLNPTAFVPDGGPWLAFQGASSAGLVQSGLLGAIGGTSIGMASAPQVELQAALPANCNYFLAEDGVWLTAPSQVSQPPSFLTLPVWDCANVRSGHGLERALLRLYDRLAPGLGRRTVLGLAGVAVRFGTSASPRARRDTLAVYDVTALSSAPTANDPPGTEVCVVPTPRNGCGEARVTPLLHCGTPCLDDELTDLRPAEDHVEVECTGAQEQRTWSLSYGDVECRAQLVTGRSSRFRVVREPGEGTRSAGHLVQRGPHGQLWVGVAPSLAQPLVLDEAPLGLVAPRLEDGGVGEPRAVTSRGFARPHEQVGLVRGAGPDLVAVGPEGLGLTPSGLVMELTEDLDAGVLLASRRVATLEALAAERSTLALATRPDGGRTLLVTSGDTLYGADERGWRRVPARLVPQPGLSLRALALLPGGVGGYVATASGVHAFSSASENDWVTRAVPLPSGRVLEVWADQGLARVAFVDGRVLTLPSGVAVGAPADGTTMELVDVLGACGQTFGLTASGLWVLGDGATWQQVPLDAGVVFNETLGEGALHFAEGDVFVFNGVGGAVRFHLDGCPR